MDTGLAASALLLGFLMGMRHALEADHLAAVASLATRVQSPRGLTLVAAAWGLGHAAALFLLGALLITAGAALPPRVGQGLELAAGIVLALLGVDVLVRAWRQRVHVHEHRHADGTRHLHAHSHPRGALHEHHHPTRVWPRCLLVGVIHGAAGSAVLLLLSVRALAPASALASIALYALGSVMGMLLLSTAISLPLRRWPLPAGGRIARLSQLALGVTSIALGSWIGVRAGALLAGV